MTTTTLVINLMVTTNQEHDHPVVSGRVSDRVEHPTASPQVTPRADAGRGGDLFIHLAPPFSVLHLFLLLLCETYYD